MCVSMCVCLYHFSFPSADNYLLQIQPYNFTSSKAKVEPKPDPTTKPESDDSPSTVAPATGQKEAVPQWYDVDVVRGTQYTVSGYNVKVETPTDQGQQEVRQRISLLLSFILFPIRNPCLLLRVCRRWSYNRARLINFVCVVSIHVVVVPFLMWQHSRHVCQVSLGHPLLFESVRYTRLSLPTDFGTICSH